QKVIKLLGVQTFHFILLNNKGSTPHPQWPGKNLNHIRRIAIPSQVQSYQLASNGLVALNGVKLLRTSLLCLARYICLIQNIFSLRQALWTANLSMCQQRLTLK
ncbi:hypothetical protein PROFUN_16501, partial [Planoprotostelium fungivorum]